MGNQGPSPPNSIEVDFLDLLEKEEEDFANQIRKQKSFLQNVFREKEDLAQLCVNQTAKLSKLESERMEWQRKIIQIEREKRDHLEKLDKEKQDHQQSARNFEMVKRDLDKLTSDSAIVSKERNDAVSRLGKELKEVEKLEADRRDLFARIDALERQKNDKMEGSDTRNNMGDLNMKLKLEIGSLKSENDKLHKSNEAMAKEKSELNDRMLANKVGLKNAQEELKQTSSKLSESGESCRNLKNLLEASQTELSKFKTAEGEMKLEITRLKKELSSHNDSSTKTQKDYLRIEKEKKEGIQKIQQMHNEIRDLKSKLQDYEAGKVQDVKKLEDSLTETLKSNKKVQEALEEVKKEKQKVEFDQKNLQALLDKRKQAEKELETMVKDLKEKLDKYDVDKKSVMKMEKAKRDVATTKHEQEKKELEDKLEKMKHQFEKVAIESKRKMSRLEEDAGGVQNVLNDSRIQIEKKEEENRALSKKLQTMEKDVQKMKEQHKKDMDRKD